MPFPFSFLTVVSTYYHFFVTQSHIVWISFYLETSSLESYSLFYDLITSDYAKKNGNGDRIIYFVLNHIILVRKCFFTSACFSPFDLKSLLNQKLSSLKAKFCFCDWQTNVSIFSNFTRLELPLNRQKMQQKYELGARLTYFLHKNEKKIYLIFIFVFEPLHLWHACRGFFLPKFASQIKLIHSVVGSVASLKVLGSHFQVTGCQANVSQGPRVPGPGFHSPRVPRSRVPGSRVSSL